MNTAPPSTTAASPIATDGTAHDEPIDAVIPIRGAIASPASAKTNHHATHADATDAGDNLLARPASAAFVKRVPIGFARSKRVLGLASDPSAASEDATTHTSPRAMTLAMADPDDHTTRDVLRRWLGGPIRVVQAEAQPLIVAINQAYGQQTGAAAAFVDQLDRDAVINDVNDLESREDLLNVSDRAPVIKLVNLVLFEAVQQQASDIHIQPYEDRLVVRMRIDGVLFDMFDLPAGVQDEVISRVKVMGKMNIAEKRLPQDGRSTVQIGDRIIDLRVSTVPASHGERVVIRLLDKSARLYTLDDLGMDPGTRERFGSLIGVEHGLVLVTGPTGSGKSTTLYAALNQINSTKRNIITLEDPIEYQLDGISQIQISDKKGMTFASGLRSVLRQDPDIVMIGEIRDRETAVMAIQAALTGHMVFSTLHTNDAASAVTRLLDLGIEPYLVSSSLVGVLAQRLVRRVCKSCGTAYQPDASELQALQHQPTPDELAGYRKGAGCDDCRNTGYHGRVGCFELLTVDESVRGLVHDRATASSINAAARQAGMHALADDGLVKVARGQTTLEEVMRVSVRAAF